MPKKKEKTRLKGFHLRVGQIKKLSKEAKKLEITESRFIRNLIDDYFGDEKRFRKQSYTRRLS